MDCTRLYEDFREWHSNAKRPFLLLDLVNANENGHTNILRSILAYRDERGGYVFLESFLGEVAGMTVGEMTDVEITAQKRAQGSGDDGCGYIDIYIEFRSDGVLKKVIVENKINDAPDMTHQLDRYVYSALGEEMDFARWIGDPAMHNAYGDEYADIRLLYLTRDGQKVPAGESFTETLRRNMGESYVPVSYANDILPWLENAVLPRLPFGEDGLMIMGLKQYIAYLKYLVTDSDGIWKPFPEIRGLFLETDAELYDSLSDIHVDGVADDDASLIAFRKQMDSFRRRIFDDSDLLPLDWKIYVTPSFLCLYRQSWRDVDDKEFAVPSLVFMTGNADKYRSGRGRKVKWTLCLSHLPGLDAEVQSSERGICRLCRELERLDMYRDSVVSANHNINRCFGAPHSIDLDFDIDDRAERVGYLNMLIESLGNEISMIDDTVRHVVQDR